MILFLSDVHCRYEFVNAQLAHAEQRQEQPVAAVVVLGDFGLFEPNLKRFFRRRGERFARPVFVIEGNHEDFARLPQLAAAYRDVFTHLPRGSVETLDGHRCLCLGGAAYMDAHTTPRGATLEPADIEACLRYPPGAVDLILTHDCPRGIGVTNAPGFEHYGPPGFAGGDRLAARFAPRFWFFGHHHRWIEHTLGATRCVGLPQSWRGYALLDTDGRLTTVRHFVHIPRTCLMLRVWRSLVPGACRRS